MWCLPRTMLVVMRSCDDPAQVLWAMRQAEIVPGAKIVLAQLNAESEPGPASTSPFQSLPPWTPKTNPFPLADSGRSLMWSEIIRRAFVMRGISAHEIPGIVQAFEIDRIILTADRGHAWAQRLPLEASLLSKLPVPVWILGRGMALSLQAPLAPRRILVPVSLSTDATTVMQFACGLGQYHNAAVSVLHVIEHSTGESPDLGRTPLTVKAFLSRAARAISLSGCSIEIAVRQGDPATRILEYNAQRQHDLVLLHSRFERSRRGLRGSTVFDRLCYDMPCPIAVIGNAMDSRVHGMRNDRDIQAPNAREVLHEVR